MPIDGVPKVEAPASCLIDDILLDDDNVFNVRVRVKYDGHIFTSK